jgi:signal transduction histidine kinase
LKHSSSSKILVNVYRDKTDFQIEIKDNGKGFDETTTILSNGLNNLRKRAREINGVLEINSLQNIGTTVKLQFNKE